MIMATIMGKQHESNAFPLLLDTRALFGPLLRDVLLEAAWDGMHCPR